jgi:NAD(P)-dependent dehydrogenase (short-subunit alcohol dehydrogenase family)
MRGCSVALVDVNEKGLLESQQMMAGFSGTFTIHVADVTREEQVAALPEAILKEHPHIDMLFNNAGITIDRSFADHSLQDWQKIMGINLWGVIYGCHHFLPHSGEASAVLSGEHLKPWPVFWVFRHRAPTAPRRRL